MALDKITRRELLQISSHLGILMLAQSALPSYVLGASSTSGTSKDHLDEIDITIGKIPFQINGKKGEAIAMNGSVPGPIIRLHEGREAIIRVKNTLNEVTSIHWHGIILPQPMDGVPGVAFAGIKPGETFTYRFPVVQSGTYWCHSHSGGQEQLGLYAPLIIEPKNKDPNSFDRDYVILFSDWSFLDPMDIIAKLKKKGGYFNNQRLTIGDFIEKSQKVGFSAALSDRLNWMRMRMDPTDILDVTGSTYTYLANGRSADTSWTGLFKKERRSDFDLLMVQQ